MMHVTHDAVASAFERFERLTRTKNWFDKFTDTYKLYGYAERAFAEEHGLNDFRQVYDELRKWQVFRRGSQHWSVEEAYGKLRALPVDLRSRCLSQLEGDDWCDVWNAIQAVQDIKQNKSDPSLVAISKFLHFWNPRLFVIFDVAVMESFVFGHEWLGDRLKSPAVAAVLQQLGLKDKMRLGDYVRVLAFASDLIRTNPVILTEFAARYEAIGTYEATALEWFLLGLVEVPPEGWLNSNQDMG